MKAAQTRFVTMSKSDAEVAQLLAAAHAHRQAGRLVQAEAIYRQVLDWQPRHPEAHNDLGLVLTSQGRLEQARTHFERALALRPASPEANDNLARTLKNLGLPDEAVPYYRRAADLSPGDAQLHSNLVFALQYQPGLDAATLGGEFQRWHERHAAPLAAGVRSHSNGPSPERRLKIGYVSADFRQHPASFFLYPLLRAHDARQVEVFIYASVRKPDAVTAGLRTLAAVWRDVGALSDETLAARIRADGIDILVDLSMHTIFGRLPVFARRPAPVQVSWLAYAGTTGLPAIDYRLTDAHMDPPSAGPSPFPGGEPVRLPDSWCCYHPLAETPAVADLPAGDGRPVTFGCLNQFAKVNPEVLRLWGRVLAAVPGSLLLLHAPDEETVHRRVRSLLAETGGEAVDGSRVSFVPPQGRQDYLRTYGRIDIGLDPFPFNGMTTTCEALWMGVPVITTLGQTPGARVGGGLLATVGLGELVAHSDAGLVEIAVALAGDLPRLAHLRATMRARLQASPLMDGPRFARHVEAAYRAMWRRWCSGR